MAEAPDSGRRDTEPGDVDGPWGLFSTQLAVACEDENLPGWEFRTTWAFVGEPFDPDLAPDGGGWVRNVQKAGGGEIVDTRHGKQQQRSYWRRKQVRL